MKTYIINPTQGKWYIINRKSIMLHNSKNNFTIYRTPSIFLYEKKCVYIAYTDGFSNDHFRNKIQDYK